MSGAAAAGFTWVDWSVVVAVLAGTTLVGARMAGRQASIRDFFLGGRRLPWYAVSASIVATEISAVTYVSLPSVVFKEGGDLTYLQLGLIGSFLARILVGWVLVPAYYAREVYSPYDYVGHRLGEGARRTASALFAIGGVLGQSARVYLTAVVLEVVLADELQRFEAATGIAPLVASIGAIGVVAVLWTWMGGIATVVWTDAVLFLLFLAGCGVALWTIGARIEGGLGSALADGWAAGKLRFFDFDPDPTKAYTFWAALFAASWSGVGSYGTDQLMAQRMFCCRDAREARRAIVASIVAMVVTALVSLVGVGLWAYYREHPMGPATLAAYARTNDRVFPLFITEVLPPGFKGLVIAGAFAAAISSLDSILAALSQTSLAVLYLPWRARRAGAPGAGRAGVDDGPDDDRRALWVSRGFVALWAAVLCATAVGMQRLAAHYGSILDLALAMAGFTGGALLAGVALALLRRRVDGAGYAWSGPLSVAAVFAVAAHDDVAQDVCRAFALVMAAAWTAALARRRHRGHAPGRLAVQSAALALGLALPIVLARYGVFPNGRSLAWPWYIPVGSVVAFLWGLALAGPPARPATP